MAIQKLLKAAVLETHGAALRVAPAAVHGSSVGKYGSTRLRKGRLLRDKKSFEIMDLIAVDQIPDLGLE